MIRVVCQVSGVTEWREVPDESFILFTVQAMVIAPPSGKIWAVDRSKLKAVDIQYVTE